MFSDIEDEEEYQHRLAAYESEKERRWRNYLNSRGRAPYMEPPVPKHPHSEREESRQNNTWILKLPAALNLTGWCVLCGDASMSLREKREKRFFRTKITYIVTCDTCYSVKCELEGKPDCLNPYFYEPSKQIVPIDQLKEHQRWFWNIVYKKAETTSHQHEWANTVIAKYHRALKSLSTE